jgi:hypothetical protein
LDVAVSKGVEKMNDEEKEMWAMMTKEIDEIHEHKWVGCPDYSLITAGFVKALDKGISGSAIDFTGLWTIINDGRRQELFRIYTAQIVNAANVQIRKLENALSSDQRMTLEQLPTKIRRVLFFDKDDKEKNLPTPIFCDAFVEIVVDHLKKTPLAIKEVSCHPLIYHKS